MTALQARGNAAYQYLVETAARICETPLAGIVLLNNDTLSFKAVVGLPSLPPDLPVDGAPCLQLIKNSPDPVIVIKDACAGEPTRPPLAVGEQPLSFWAIARMADPSGGLVGLMWIADIVTRDLTPVQLRSLELLARQTMLLIKERV